MRKTMSGTRALRVNLVAAAVASCFASGGALANPTGATVANGAVSMATPLPNQLHITNSPNSIIHWQGFSIGAGELTRFIQQSSSSAVLNRVISGNPSEIFGALESNGRVFLINPNGIVFGAGSMVDVAGLVASTLNLTDASFLSGNYLFQPVPGAGRVDNFGNIRAGDVYLVGPAVSNGGLITSPQGEVVLAAGNSVELMNVGTPGLSVSISAGANEALNLGGILAESGRVGIYAGLIEQRGSLSANAAFVGPDGSIQLKAVNATTFGSGSNTVATGALGIETGELTVAGNVQSGPQSITASGAVVVANEPGGFAQLYASGGQSISARSLEVTAQAGGSAMIANDFGNQIIAVDGGGASTGVDVRTGPGGGFAQVFNFAPGGLQTVAVTDADHIRVDGAGGGSAAINTGFDGMQSLSITGSGANTIQIGSAGALGASTLGGGLHQSIIAGTSGQNGSIAIVGSAVNGRISGIIGNPGFGGSQSVLTSGTLSVTGGSASAQPNNFPAGIFHNGTGQQTINAQSIVLQGGAVGAGNSAQIGANNGSQLVNADSISITGGPGGTGNSAHLRANLGQQMIFADQLTLNAGAGGVANFAAITAPLQSMVIDGNLAVSGGGSLSSATTGGGARIGGTGAGPTNITLEVGGSVVLNGGSVAGSVIGGNNTNIQRNDILMNVVGDVILNPGAASGTRLGSAAGIAAGGDIEITAGGTIALNSAAPGNSGAIRTTENVNLRANRITQGADAEIAAGSLRIETVDGAALVGMNSLSAFNALSTGIGEVAVRNASPLLTLTDVQTFGNAFSVQQAGNLRVDGAVLTGPQTLEVSGGLLVQNEPGTFANLVSSAGQSIDAEYVEVIALAGGSAGISNSGGVQRIATSGTNAAGEGLAVRTAGGNFAGIDSFMGEQQIDVRNAERAVIDGATGIASVTNLEGVQSFVVTGSGANSLVLGSTGALAQAVIGGGAHQTVVAGNAVEQGSITLIGTAGGLGNTLIVSNPVPGGTQTVSTSGALSVFGGSAAGGTAAGIFSNGIDGQQFVAADSILLQGGATGGGNSAMIGANNGSQWVSAGAGGITLRGGAAGANNFAMINQLSTNPAYTQSVWSTGPVLLEGGAGNFNFAMIRAFGGHQGMSLGDTILLAGAGGIDNFSVFQARDQDISVNGDLAIIARGSAGGPTAGGGARIGGLGGGAPTATSLRLNVAGDLEMTGGSVPGTGTILGNTPGIAAPTSISVWVGGNMALNGGTAENTSATIGSRATNLAGGNVDIRAGGDIALNGTSPDAAAAIRTADAVTMTARSIAQGAAARIEAGSLAFNTVDGASLTGANAINVLSGSNAFSGDVAFRNASDLLTVTQLLNMPGALSLQQDGNLLVAGHVSSGPQTIGVTGGLRVENTPFGFAQIGATGGQTIDAGYVEVVGNAGGSASIFNFDGEQRITTLSANAAGEGFAVRAFDGGFALVDSATGPQTIEVRDADRAVIEGASGFANVTSFGGTQSIALTGSGANALVLGGPDATFQSLIAANDQTIVAGNPGEQGSITLYGTAQSGFGNALILTFAGMGGSQSVSTNGALSVLGGWAPGNSATGIFANQAGGTQIVNAGSILVQGGDAGSGNSAQIGANNGSQVVHAGSIVVTGGAGGTGNTAMLRASAGPQTIVADEITVNAGAGGAGNFAVVIAPQQDIAVTGDVTLNGGSSAPTPTTGAVALIGGGNTLPTNLNLAVGGDLTLNGGHAVNSGAAIGNGLTGLQPTSISANVGGDVTLNPGTVANARIGSGLESPLGGDIVVNAGGTIAMNSAGPGLAGAIRTGGDVALSARRVTQGADARIEASALSVQTAEGAALAGANSVSELAMLNSVSGDVAFNNASVLLTVNGIGQVPDGALALMQQGDLLFVGDVSSGAQTIAASGDMTIAAGDGPGITVRAYGPQTFNVGGTFSLLGGSAWGGYAQTLASGPVSITTGNDLLVRGGGGLLAYALLYGGDDIYLTVGNELRIDGGSGLFAFARVQTDFWDRIFLTFPNRESGGYFVNGREGATIRGLSGFYTGLLPAVRGRGLVVEYGE